MPTKTVLGLQYGDEGKGKVVDQLVESWADIVVRFQGGDNAGHTIYDENGHKYILHGLPTGVLKSKVLNIIARGCVVNPINIVNEIKKLCVSHKDLKISSGCPAILPHHIEIDKAKYQKKIGTTARGIGPAYTEYFSRSGLTLKDVCFNFDKHKNSIVKQLQESTGMKNSDDSLVSTIKELREACFYLKNFIVDNVEEMLQIAYENKKNIVLEGAQGWGLDIWSDFYPNVTCSSPSIGGAIVSTGLNHYQIDEVIGIAKAYKTRVGTGDFPTELFGENIDKIRINLGEYGATTSRPRRIGWIDLDELKLACQRNGVDHLIITRTDSMEEFPKVKYKLNNQIIETKKWSLPDNIENLEKFINIINKATNVRNISYSYGPKRNQISWFEKNYIKGAA